MSKGRIYDKAQWKRLRKAKLLDAPLCQDCAQVGVARVATVVDHVVPVRLGGEPFPALKGLRSLCKSCHDSKTARGPEAGAIRTSKPRRGCDADGRPLDAGHPWNVQAGNVCAERTVEDGDDVRLRHQITF